METAYVFIHTVDFELQQEPFTDTSIAFIQGRVAKAALKGKQKGVRSMYLQTLLFPTFGAAEQLW